MKICLLYCPIKIMIIGDEKKGSIYDLITKKNDHSLIRCEL